MIFVLVKGLYENNMVFSKDYPIRLIGYYEPNEFLKIKIIKKTVLYEKHIKVSEDGFLLLDTIKINPSFDEIEIIVESKNGKEKITAYVGDVYIGIGQSNMTYPLKYEDKRESYINEFSKYQHIFWLRINESIIVEGEVKRPLIPQKHLLKTTGWFNLSSSETMNFSALLLMFGINLAKKVNYPIGLIDTSVPGCGIEGYLSKELIENNKKIKKYLILNNLYQENLKEINSYTVSTGIYNEKINPLKHYLVSAVLFYQGEHHVGDDKEAKFFYESLKQLILESKQTLKVEVPWILFYINANYYPQDDGFSVSRINEAIQKNEDTLKKVYIVPTYDYVPNWFNEYIFEEANPIHPTNKEYIAKRALEIYLNPNISPRIEKYKVLENKIIITYNTKLSVSEPILGFTIAGLDEKFLPAKAYLNNEYEIVIHSKYIKKPYYFTYGFQLNNTLFKNKNEYGIPLPIHRNIVSKNHYSYYGYEFVNDNKMYEFSFDPRYSVSNKKEVFENGLFHKVENQKIEVLNNFINVYTPKPNQSKPYFSVRVNLSKTGAQLMFHKFRYLTINILSVNNKETSIIGVMFKDVNNHIFGNLLEEEVILSDKIKSVSFDLFNLTKPDLVPIIEAKKSLRKVKEMEIIFKGNKNSHLIIQNIEHHD